MDNEFFSKHLFLTISVTKVELLIIKMGSFYSLVYLAVNYCNKCSTGSK